MHYEDTHTRENWSGTTQTFRKQNIAKGEKKTSMPETSPNNTRTCAPYSLWPASRRSFRSDSQFSDSDQKKLSRPKFTQLVLRFHATHILNRHAWPSLALFRMSNIVTRNWMNAHSVRMPSTATRKAACIVLLLSCTNSKLKSNSRLTNRDVFDYYGDMF